MENIYTSNSAYRNQKQTFELTGRVTMTGDNIERNAFMGMNAGGESFITSSMRVYEYKYTWIAVLKGISVDAVAVDGDGIVVCRTARRLLCDMVEIKGHSSCSIYFLHFANGEFLAKLIEVKGAIVSISCDEQLRRRLPSPPVSWIRSHWLIDKNNNWTYPYQRVSVCCCCCCYSCVRKEFGTNDTVHSSSLVAVAGRWYRFKYRGLWLILRSPYVSYLFFFLYFHNQRFTFAVLVQFGIRLDLVSLFGDQHCKISEDIH